MTAKILLIIIGLGSGDVVVPVAAQYDDAKSCAKAAGDIDFTLWARVAAVCIDSATGQIAYLRMKR